MVLGLLAAGCPSRREEDPVEMNYLWSLADAGVTPWRGLLHAAGRSEASQDTPCPDEELATKWGERVERALLVDYEYLSWFLAGSTPTYDQGQDWNLLTAPAFLDILPPRLATTKRQATDTVYRLQKLEREIHYVAVLRTQERVAPRVQGEKFHPGRVAGRLLVFDFPTAQRVCEAPVSITSSVEVFGSQKRALEDAVRKDFEVQVRRGLDESLARITRQLNL